MRISQYVYFTLISETVTAETIAAELGIEPDRTSVLGSRQLTPLPVPRAHQWSVYSPDAGQALDVQAGAVLERVAPVGEAIRGMVDRDEVTAVLVFVRYFNDPDGEEENLDPVTTPEGLVLERIAGQHQLLGWRLEPDQKLCSLRWEPPSTPTSTAAPTQPRLPKRGPSGSRHVQMSTGCFQRHHSIRSPGETTVVASAFDAV